MIGWNLLLPALSGIFIAIAAAVAEKVGERRGRPSEENVQKVVPFDDGVKTITIAAEKAGFGNRETLRQAKSVVATNDEALIESMAKRRLADEYDAAQDRGEINSKPGPVSSKAELTATTADIGLTRKDVFEARKVRDAEQAEPD